MSPAANPEDRLIALEERVSFQQRTIDDLSDVIRVQHGQIDRLTAELAELRRAVERVVESGGQGENLPHEKPPHY